MTFIGLHNLQRSSRTNMDLKGLSRTFEDSWVPIISRGSTIGSDMPSALGLVFLMMASLKSPFLGDKKDPHFGRSWRLKRQQKVSFWGIPEKFGDIRKRMRYVELWWHQN